MPASQNVVTMVWPGSTGRENRTASRRSRVGSPCATAVIAAHVSVPLPEARGRVEIVRVESTAELRAALRRALTDAAGAPALDALVMAAAVADFTPARPATTKLTRGERLTLELEPTPDLLGEVARIVRGLDTKDEPTRQIGRAHV